MKELKVSEYCRRTGMHKSTVIRWFHAGSIPGRQLPTGTILLEEPQTPVTTQGTVKRAAIYTRVSSSENKKNLTTQEERVGTFCTGNGWQVTRTVQEIGSGLNDQRPKLNKLIFSESDTWDVLVVEHRDRLTHFGFAYLEEHVKSLGKEIIVVKTTVKSDQNDLITDLKKFKEALTE